MKSKLLFLMLLCVSLSLGYICINKSAAEITVERTMTRLNSQSEPGYYQVLTKSSMECDLETFSAVVTNMQSDGFTIESETNTEDLIDIILRREDVTVRIRFDIKGNFASISSPYEKSYLPITYINESVLQE